MKPTRARNNTGNSANSNQRQEKTPTEPPPEGPEGQKSLNEFVNGTRQFKKDGPSALSAMELRLKDLRHFVRVYIDDLVIFSQNADIARGPNQRTPTQELCARTTKVYPLGPKERQLGYRTTYKDGLPVRKGRPVVDLRGLNKIVEPDIYPTPSQFFIGGGQS
ncbi:hypothetical protein EMPG_16590 [Blastomyces silverae]|uniref:Reverse transcriptase domain-containing protein n=1 Tax=Blastomyces silverae TaxID=2060906 RepID=A0A0H1BA20_9EURO|nr:hypothetical protein EMPG_16590 [Blastomyces silverae]